MTLTNTTIAHPTNRPNYTTVTYYSDTRRSLTVATSYTTPVVFYCDETFTYHRAPNNWGPTTGRHIKHALPEDYKNGNSTTTHDTYETFDVALKGALAML